MQFTSPFATALAMLAVGPLVWVMDTAPDWLWLLFLVCFWMVGVFLTLHFRDPQDRPIVFVLVAVPVLICFTAGALSALTAKIPGASFRLPSEPIERQLLVCAPVSAEVLFDSGGGAAQSLHECNALVGAMHGACEEIDKMNEHSKSEQHEWGALTVWWSHLDWTILWKLFNWEPLDARDALDERATFDVRLALYDAGRRYDAGAIGRGQLGTVLTSKLSGMQQAEKIWTRKPGLPDDLFRDVTAHQVVLLFATGDVEDQASAERLKKTLRDSVARIVVVVLPSVSRSGHAQFWSDFRGPVAKGQLLDEKVAHVVWLTRKPEDVSGAVHLAVAEPLFSQKTNQDKARAADPSDLTALRKERFGADQAREVKRAVQNGAFGVLLAALTQTALDTEDPYEPAILPTILVMVAYGVFTWYWLFGALPCVTYSRNQNGWQPRCGQRLGLWALGAVGPAVVAFIVMLLLQQGARTVFRPATATWAFSATWALLAFWPSFHRHYSLELVEPMASGRLAKLLSHVRFEPVVIGRPAGSKWRWRVRVVFVVTIAFLMGHPIASILWVAWSGHGFPGLLIVAVWLVYAIVLLVVLCLPGPNHELATLATPGALHEWFNPGCWTILASVVSACAALALVGVAGPSPWAATVARFSLIVAILGTFFATIPYTLLKGFEAPDWRRGASQRRTSTS